MPQYAPEVARQVFELLDAGKSQGEVQRLTGVSQPTISRWVKDRRLNGHQPTDDPPVETTSLQRVEILGEPVSPENSAALRSDAQTSHDLTDLAARVASLGFFAQSDEKVYFRRSRS